MKTKLPKILLIDDSEADNFLTKRVIKKADVVEEVIVKYSGQDALDYLTSKSESEEEYPNPELIFLDINMPGMNGWEFLEKYRALDKSMRKGIVICMLTTSYAESDRQKAKELGVVQTFTHKPMTKAELLNIIEEHYPDRI